jgi:hypothetical protein
VIAVSIGFWSENRIPSLAEMDLLSRIVTYPQTGLASELGLDTRVGSSQDVVLIIGNCNRLTVPQGYRLAVRVYP